MTDEPIYEQGHVHIGRPGSSGPSPKYCCHAVHEGGHGVGFYQCNNGPKYFRLVARIDWRTGEATTEPVERGYCGTHDPVRVAERKKKRNEKNAAEEVIRKAKQDKRRTREEFVAACIEAVRKIGAGHNDPRTLALEVLQKEPENEIPNNT